MRLTGIFSILQSARPRCRHRFGFPISGYVRCLRCTRCFPLELTPQGEWQIGKSPLPFDPALATGHSGLQPR